MKYRKTHPRKCSATHKTMFPNEKEAGRAMMRIWSHDTKANIYDLHVYKCPSCSQYHVGHISYYQQSVSQTSANLS